MLRKVRTGFLLLVGDLVPSFMQPANRTGLQWQHGLPSLASSSEQNVVDQCVYYLLGFDWNWDVDAQTLADGFSLPQQDFHYHLVNFVVGSVKEYGLDGRVVLAETVHSTVSLFQAVGIPGQVVVDHSVVVFLQVDAFAEAVGGYQHSSWMLSEVHDNLFALFTVSFVASYCPDAQTGMTGLELAIELVLYVICSLNEPAINDGVVTLV